MRPIRDDVTTGIIRLCQLCRDKPIPGYSAIALSFAIRPSALEFASCVKQICQSSLPHYS